MTQSFNMSSPVRQVLITGGSSGIGRATALCLAQVGIEVVLIGRTAARLAQAVDTIVAEGGQARFHCLDLAELSQVKAQILSIAADLPGLDVLINCAGIGLVKPLADISLEDWQQVIDLNLTSPLLCAQGVLPCFRQRGRGLIINVASMAARQTFPDWGAYSASKAGLLAWGKSMAQEERNHGIRVVTILPGATDTPLWDTQTLAELNFNRAAMLAPETIAQSISHVVTLPPEAVVEELTMVPAGGAL
ncbi:MAG: SDR family oxidoreductase [Cyanobacteria bacterium P01_H01_bin.15]